MRITGENIVLSEEDGTAISAALREKLNICSVYNALDLEMEGYALDARQGKALKGLLDGLSAEVEKKLAATNVANNLTTEQEGYALDARQGKALADLANGKASQTTAAVSLTAAAWSGEGPYTQTVSAIGVTAGNVAVVSPAPASFTEWSECGVYASAQAAGELTFIAENKPETALTANVLCIN